MLSCCLQLVGNVLYGAALGYRSMPMLLIGRFIGGAGTAEAVNRRYIADVIPPLERTAASVAFVTATAVGMCVYPTDVYYTGPRRVIVPTLTLPSPSRIHVG